MRPKNAEREVEQRETYSLMKSSGLLNSLDDAGFSLGSKTSKPGYTNAQFRYKACAHQFSRSVTLEWLTIRNKLGEERALAEYRTIQ